MPHYSIDITIQQGYNKKYIKKEYFNRNISDIVSIMAKKKFKENAIPCIKVWVCAEVNRKYQRGNKQIDTNHIWRL